MIDLRKKLQDKANEIVNEAISKTPGYQPGDLELDNFLKGVVALSLQQGFIFGVTSIKQTAEYLLNDIKEWHGKEFG